jgi:flagellar motor protein MotB
MKRFAIATCVVVLSCMGAGVGVTGCAAPMLSVPHIEDADRAKESPASREAELLAPQAIARADEQRALAHKARKDGDDVAAVLYADRAIAAYEHAFILARLAKATHEQEDAETALATASSHAKELAAERAQIDAEGEELEKQLAVARDAQPLVPVGAANDGKREGARLVAARALTMEARLLCGSARLVSTDDATTKAIADVEKEVAVVEAQIESKPHPAPIDAAARVRAKCLDRLTTARRASNGATDPDTLLAELSASGGLDPSRDERGVVVTLRDLFAGASLAAHADEKLAELGRVAAAHPDMGVQVVVNDAAPPSKADEAMDAKHADAVVTALVRGGATVAHVKSELAGVRAPIVDPGDAAHRARNARVDVVFVTR